MSVIDGGTRNAWLLVLAIMIVVFPGNTKGDIRASLIELFFLVLAPIVVAVSVWQLRSVEKVTLFDLATLTLVYGAWLFTLASSILQRGLARKLTVTRGEKWTKELDYIYLFFAIIGLLFTINRLEAVSGRLGVPDAFGPLLVITAFAVRGIKARAEVNDWNKFKD